MKYGQFVPFTPNIANEKDYTSFVRLHRSIFDKDNVKPFNLTTAALKRYLVPGGKLYVIKNESDKVVAGAAVQRLVNTADQKQNFLWGVATDVNYRNKGLAGNLLDKIINDHRNTPLILKVLNTNPMKDVVTKLYKSKGFKFFKNDNDTSNTYYKYG